MKVTALPARPVFWAAAFILLAAGSLDPFPGEAVWGLMVLAAIGIVVTATEGAKFTLDIHGLLPVVAAYAPVGQLALRRPVSR